MMWGYPYGYGGWGGVLPVLMLLLGIAIVALLIWGLFRLLGSQARRTLPPGPQPNALETLQQRYARGEIDEQTFLRMREQLTARDLVAPSEPTR